jgi:hypothetical protein
LFELAGSRQLSDSPRLGALLGPTVMLLLLLLGHKSYGVTGMHHEDCDFLFACMYGESETMMGVGAWFLHVIALCYFAVFAEQCCLNTNIVCK